MVGIQNIRSADQTDRRASVRRPLIAEARLRHPDGTITPCILQNISDGGAMIAIQADVELPQTFEFEITGNIAVARRCSLVWRQGRFAGMEFVDRRKRPREQQV